MYVFTTRYPAPISSFQILSSTLTNEECIELLQRYSVFKTIKEKLRKMAKFCMTYTDKMSLILCFLRTTKEPPVAQLVEHRAAMREVAGSNPGQINIRDVKITEEKVLLFFNDICNWLDFASQLSSLG